MSTTVIKTRDFGEAEINENAVINFPNGLYAFEKARKFVLLSPMGEGTYPMWLQSAEDENLCFIVFSPNEIAADYSPELTDDMKEAIKLDNGEEPDFLVMTVIPKDFKNATVNLKSPIIINSAKGIAAQVILEDDYQIRFPIFKDRGDR